MTTQAQRAKTIRQTLKSEFPGQKFSVRSIKRGASREINISWADGPSYKNVKALVDGYNIFLSRKYSLELVTSVRDTVSADTNIEAPEITGGDIHGYGFQVKMFCWKNEHYQEALAQTSA